MDYFRTNWLEIVALLSGTLCAILILLLDYWEVQKPLRRILAFGGIGLSVTASLLTGYKGFADNKDVREGIEIGSKVRAARSADPKSREDAVEEADAYLRKLETKRATFNCAHGYVATMVAQAQNAAMRAALTEEGEDTLDALERSSGEIEDRVDALKALFDDKTNNLVNKLIKVSTKLGSEREPATVIGKLKNVDDVLAGADSEKSVLGRLTKLNTNLEKVGPDIVTINTALSGPPGKGGGLVANVQTLSSDVTKLQALTDAVGAKDKPESILGKLQSATDDLSKLRGLPEAVGSKDKPDSVLGKLQAANDDIARLRGLPDAVGAKDKPDSVLGKLEVVAVNVADSPADRPVPTLFRRLMQLHTKFDKKFAEDDASGHGITPASTTKSE